MQTYRKFERCLGGTRRKTGSLIDVLEGETQTDRKFDRCLGGTRRQIGSLIDVLERHADRQEV